MLQAENLREGNTSKHAGEWKWHRKLWFRTEEGLQLAWTWKAWHKPEKRTLQIMWQTGERKRLKQHQLLLPPQNTVDCSKQTADSDVARRFWTYKLWAELTINVPCCDMYCYMDMKRPLTGYQISVISHSPDWWWEREWSPSGNIRRATLKASKILLQQLPNHLVCFSWFSPHWSVWAD